MERYGVQGSVEGDRTVQMASGDSSGGMYQISGLQSFTNYSIDVAAVNSVGTGVYSTDVFQSTQCMHDCILKGRTCTTLIVCFLLPVEALVLSVVSATATTVSLSWSSAGFGVDSYEVMWQRDTSGDCPDEDDGNTILAGGSSTYNIFITGLEEASTYTMTVTAMNEFGYAITNNITATTSGEGITVQIICDKINIIITNLFSSSICCSQFCECI